MEETATKLYGRHATHLHRYSTKTVNSIFKEADVLGAKALGQVSFLMDTLTDKEKALFIAGKYTTKRLKALKKVVDGLSSSIRSVIAARLRADAKDLASYEIAFSDKLMNALVVVPEYTAVSEAVAIGEAMARPVLGVLIKDRLKDQSLIIRRQVNDAIREGFTTGEPNSSIIRRIQGTRAEKYKNGILGGPTKTRVEELVRTSMNHVANITRQESLKALGVKRIQWLSVLDGRTTKICASRDLKIWGIDEGPRPPAHPNCRSTIKPYLGSVGGTRPFVAHNKPVAKVKPNKRKIGKVKATTNFEKFLTGQSAAFQKEWLGPTRYKLWKQGKYKISRFVDPRSGRQYTISKLRAQDNALFAELGL